MKMIEPLLMAFNQAPAWFKTSADIAAVGTAFGTGIATFFGALVPPLAALASLAALVYTVLRAVHLIKHWNKP